MSKKKQGKSRGSRRAGGRVEEPLTANFVSLGCPKNLVDSERMLAVLGEAGVVLTSPESQADVTIINTCGFIEEARQEAYEAIEEALERKRRGEVGHVVVAGCLAQYLPERLTERFPEVDAVVGLAHRDEMFAVVRQVVQGTAGGVVREVGPFERQMTSDRARLRLTHPRWTYLRVSEGCSMGCTFCSIPAIRGAFRSKGPEEVLAEAAEMVSDGAVELNLIGQETSGYGRDLAGGVSLAMLLRGLEEMAGLEWVRVLYSHPATMSDEVIAAMAECSKVVKYLDLPLQHISDPILKAMGRRVTRRQTEELLGRLREAMPGIALRTTVIVGFPGETREQFEELLEFVRAVRFMSLGAFVYSPEEGTAAVRLGGRVDPEEGQRRYEAVMEAQQEVAFGEADKLVGREMDCLVTDALEAKEAERLGLERGLEWLVGRLGCQAPEIDPVTYVASRAGERVEAGVMRVRVERRVDYDLVGSLVARVF